MLLVAKAYPQSFHMRAPGTELMQKNACNFLWETYIKIYYYYYFNPRRLIAEAIQYCSISPQACTLPISMFSSEEAIRKGWTTGLSKVRKRSENNISKKVLHGLKDAVKEELVSVCVPHGGRTEFLYDCLYSLLAQSMRKMQTILYRKQRGSYQSN